MQVNLLCDDFSEIDNDFKFQVLNFINEWKSPLKVVKVQTSGSTGMPKVFDIEKEKMRYSAKKTCDFLKLKKGNTALLCLPLEYISGKMMLVRVIERGLKVLVKMPSVSPLETLNHEVDFCAMTPLQVENSLDKIHLIKNLIIGGAEVSEKLKNAIISRLSSVGNYSPLIYETYGMSETLSHIALKQIFPIREDYFKCLEGIDISKDDRGCLVIDAPKINSKKLVTNDLIELKDGKEFRFLGRIDNVINSGGAKIFPETLESLVKKKIPNEVVFIGVPDEKLGQKLVLVIESKETEIIKQQLSMVNYQYSFHRPKEIIFVEKIKRTPNGKVNRREVIKEIITKTCL